MSAGRVFRRLFGLSAVAALAALAAACGSGEAQKQREKAPPTVKAEAPQQTRFADRIDAVGTAVANEQVTVSAPVTERIVRLNFDDGDFVQRGQIIAVLAQGQQDAQMREAQARLREAEQQLRRVEALKDRGFATRADYDTRVAAVASARAQAQSAGADIGDRVIRAPFSGWVSLRNISVGAIASQGTAIATISDIGTIKLDFTVPETMLPALRQGQVIEARSEAYPDQPFRGVIATIDPVIDPNTRAVTVRARLPNPDRRLRPGMLLNVTIESAPRQSLSVPELAIIGEGDNRYVFTLDAQNRARRTQVRTGVRANGRVEIVSGLSANARVVTDGVVKVADGMEVRLPGQGGQGGRGQGGSGQAGAGQGGGGQRPAQARPGG